VAAASAAILALVLTQTIGASGAPAPLGATLTVIGPQNGGGEPSDAIGPDGTIYVSAPGPGMQFYRSPDRGATWIRGGSPQNSSGDTTVNVDASGAVYQSNLNGGEGISDTLQVDVFKSFDKGDTWPQKGRSRIEDSNSTGQPALVDRQWTDAWIPPGKTTDQALVCMTYHDWGPSQMWVTCSKDGGRNFELPVDAITSPAAQAASFCNTIPGGLKIVPVGHLQGRIYIAWLAADPANPVTGCNLTQLAAFHSIWVAWSDDQGQTWTDQLVYDAGPLHDGSEIFADLTLDNKDNPYVAFAMNIRNEFDIWVEASFDEGQTWNGKTDGTGAPYKVNANTGTHYFPAIAAGDPGQVDVAYLATPFVTPTTPHGKPQPAADADADWYLFVGQSRNLLTGHPTWQNARLTPTPMHHGDICTLGIFCSVVPGTNRNILDFIDVAASRSGKFFIAYTDDHNYADGAFVMARQSTGPTIGPGGH
jgi:hypothetical protein